MTNSRMGEIIAPDTIRFERTLPGPIERVWSYLVDPQKRSKWLASGPMEERLGGALRLEWHHRDLDAEQDAIPERFKQLENGHSMDSRITRYEPPKVLGFQWGKRADRLSEVIIELSERDGQVHLVLTHQHLPDRSDLLGVAGGWHTHLDILVEHMNGHTSPGFWGAFTQTDAQYRERLGME